MFEWWQRTGVALPQMSDNADDLDDWLVSHMIQLTAQHKLGLHPEWNLHKTQSATGMDAKRRQKGIGKLSRMSSKGLCMKTRGNAEKVGHREENQVHCGCSWTLNTSNTHQ